MNILRSLVRRGAALCLAALLVLPVFAADGKSEAAGRQEDLDFLYGQVLARHPDLFANTPEAEFLALKAEIEARLETESKTDFLLDLMRLTALVGDSHTMLSIGNAADLRIYPFSLVRRGTAWYLSAAAPEDRALLCQEVTALAGRPVEDVVTAFGQIFGSDNRVHLRRNFRQASNVADIYEYLGLVEPGAPLTVEMKDGKTLSLEPVDQAAANELEAVRIADLITGTPETAQADAYYAAKPLSESTYYIQYNACAEEEDLPMEDFAAQVAEDLEKGSYDRILLDLRNNGGGSDGVIWPLFSLIRTRQLVQGDDVELVGLIGERTFSSALINAVEIQEMGGVLAGEAAGGSVCHFGAVKTFALPNSKVPGQLSSKYIDLSTLLDAGAGRGVEALEPDVEVAQTLEDTLAGKDTLVDWLMGHPERLEAKAYPDAPLTRGRFIGLLYEAAGEPEAALMELPFQDCLGGIEWYTPALGWAKATGIALGDTEGNFNAARPVTWKEAAVFLARAAAALNLPEPDPATNRRGPVPAALAGGWMQSSATLAWDLGLLPASVDYSQPPTREQGEGMAESLGVQVSR